MQLTIEVPDFKFAIGDIVRVPYSRRTGSRDLTVIGFEIGAGYTDLSHEEAMTANIADYVVAVYPVPTASGGSVELAVPAMTTLDKIQLETYGVKVGIRRWFDVNGEPAVFSVRQAEREQPVTDKKKHLTE